MERRIVYVTISRRRKWKVRLSYSTIKDLYEMPHTWINKQMGLKTKELPVFEEGKQVQKIIVNHILGKEINDKIKKREESDKTFRLPKFEVMEEEDFDPRLKFEYDFDDNYYIIGWPDAIDKKHKLIGDVKAYNQGFKASMLRDSMQWRVYSLAHEWAKEVIYISASREFNNPRWAESIKVLSVEIKDIDRAKAVAWIRGAIKIIESGDFKLEKNDNYKKCLYIGCIYCNE